MSEQKACPFCGSHLLALEEGGSGVWVACYDCDAEGPPGKDADEAWRLWNTRSSGGNESEPRNA